MTVKGIWNKKVGLKGLIVVGAVALLLGLGISVSLDLLSPGRAVDLVQEPTPESRQLTEHPRLPDFASLAKKFTPVVVNISSTQVSDVSQGFVSPFGEEDPFSEFWRRFFGGPLPRGPFRQKSLGSGFIVDEDGSILTNNHVVENAEKIAVKLSDGREFEAKVAGRDAKTDIALIKIDAKNSLPTAVLGDSDDLEVGEWVLAIGNPFGLDSSVTAGIVSAKSRIIGAGPYDDFIQTDASINPGNSGGPLINLRGQVVGINTAIFSRTGGNIGIGFAIPINLVKELLPQLKDSGKITRGYLGVHIQKVTPEIAESLGLKQAHGALVANVAEGGPAESAGVKVGDVIVEFNGKKVEDSHDLPIIVARTPVGKKVAMKVLRDKKEVTLSATVGELKEEEIVASARESGELGLTVQGVTPQIAESLGLEQTEGVVVTAVEPGSPADESGLRRGDVILEIGDKRIRNVADYKKVVAGIKKGKAVRFWVARGETKLFFALKIPQ